MTYNITIPRGQNIGQTIINKLIALNVYPHNEIKTITVSRDTVNKVNKANIILKTN